MAAGDTLQLEIVTPHGRVAKETAAEVIVPTVAGELGILPHHTPLAAVTHLGVVGVRLQPGDSNDQLDHYVVTEGLAEITGDSVRILVDEAQHVDSIDQLRVNQELAAAQQRLKSSQDLVEQARAQAAINRATTWLQAASLNTGRPSAKSSQRR